MKKIRFSFFLILLSLATISFAQEKEQGSNFKDKVFFGGGFGAWFSESYSYVELSPTVGYRITQKLSGGVGFTYIYTNRRYYYINGDSFKKSSSIYGPRLFARMNVYGPIFLQGEYESLSVEYPQGSDFSRSWVPGLFLGGGFMQPLGKKGGIGIMFLYNFQHDDLRSPYNSEWVYRMGVFF